VARWFEASVRDGTLKNFLSICGFLAAVAALVGLLFLHHLIAKNPILIGVQVAAVLLMLWARRTFGLRSFHAAASPSEGGLVTTGPYRYWRHPIYASILYFVWAGQVEAPAGVPLALAAVATLGLLARMLIEESFLTAAYPEYVRYAQQAKRFVPFVF
jgi:protein-S-isoprenylcysteine O-methyltransferase Ste14